MNTQFILQVFQLYFQISRLCEAKRKMFFLQLLRIYVHANFFFVKLYCMWKSSLMQAITSQMMTFCCYFAILNAILVIYAGSRHMLLLFFPEPHAHQVLFPVDMGTFCSDHWAGIFPSWWKSRKLYAQVKQRMR